MQLWFGGLTPGANRIASFCHVSIFFSFPSSGLPDTGGFAQVRPSEPAATDWTEILRRVQGEDGAIRGGGD